MATSTHETNEFTTAQYQLLLVLAKQNYEFIKYSEIDFSKKFILWRHDCDFSLNRSLRLAAIENEMGVKSTFFLNPHSEFYNLNEKKQHHLVHSILALGHDIALHFDSDFYGLQLEDDLDLLVSREADLLEQWFGKKITAFSFHNPTEFTLNYMEEKYGGLINCYSSFFKEKISYCSDSNGYWRFQPLHDVLTAASDPFLQVLTHPGWWQERKMLPRERILRCINGRAKSVIDEYDEFLLSRQRRNIGINSD